MPCDLRAVSVYVCVCARELAGTRAYQGRADDKWEHIRERVLGDAHGVGDDRADVHIELVVEAMRPVHARRVHPTVRTVVAD